MKRHSPISDATGPPFCVRVSARALRDRRDSEEWWLRNHGPIAPSRLEAETEHAFDLLAGSPELGYHGIHGRRTVRKLRLACGFFILYLVRARRREVVILRILAASRLHG